MASVRRCPAPSYDIPRNNLTPAGRAIFGMICLSVQTISINYIMLETDFVLLEECRYQIWMICPRYVLKQIAGQAGCSEWAYLEMWFLIIWAKLCLWKNHRYCWMNVHNIFHEMASPLEPPSPPMLFPWITSSPYISSLSHSTWILKIGDVPRVELYMPLCMNHIWSYMPLRMEAITYTPLCMCAIYAWSCMDCICHSSCLRHLGRCRRIVSPLAPENIYIYIYIYIANNIVKDQSSNN